MKWKLPPRYRGWCRWFAWHPVPVMPYGERRWVWWEWVEREKDSCNGGFTGYQYRLPAGASELRDE